MSERKTRQSRTVVKKAGWWGLGLAGLAKAAFHIVPKHVVSSPWIVALAAVGVAVFLASLFPRVLQAFRARRWAKAARETGRWPLGERYRVTVESPGHFKSAAGDLVIEAERIRFNGRSTDAEVDSSIEADEVDVIHVRSVWIEIVGGDGALRVKTSSYADRERLLWELAVRCNDAVERGIDATSPSTRSALAPDLDDLDRRMTGSGLGSALAGPAASANPSPPRKSGLGVGLFPPPHDEQQS